jgi:hypothetical protein
MADISGLRGGQNHAPTATLATVSPTYSGRVTAGFRVIELRSNNNLDQAYVFTSGPTETFTKLLAGIESSIADSIGLLGGDVELNAGHITQIDRIVGNAENLQLLIQKAVKNREKRLRLVGTEGLQDV